MEKILGDFVSVGGAGDGDWNNCTGIILFEEGDERLHEQRLEAGGDVGDVRLHMKVAEQVYSAIVEVEGAVQLDGGSGHLAGQAFRGDDAVAYLRSTV